MKTFATTALLLASLLALPSYGHDAEQQAPSADASVDVAAQSAVAVVEPFSGLCRKAATMLSTETMILRKAANDWRTTHIHWPSRPKK